MVSRRSVVSAVALALGLAAFVTGPLAISSATAQTPMVTLKLHHFLPAQSNQHRDWFVPWAKKIEDESGGRIKVEIYPSMQLGGKPPQLFDQAKDGVVDIVWTLAGNTPGRFPRLEVFELPWVPSASAKKTSVALHQYYEKYSKDELKDVKVLAIFAHAKGNLYTKDKVVKLPDDIKGMKIRVPTRTINDTLQLMGASPQGIPAPAVPEALAKGVVDGVMFPYEVVPSLKVDELTNRVSVFAGDRSLYTAVFLFLMNKAKYDALPDDLRKVIDANSGAALSAQVGGQFDGWDALGLAAIEKAKSPIHTIDGADLAAWKAATSPIIQTWIDARTKAGDNGAELVKAANDLIEVQK